MKKLFLFLSLLLTVAYISAQSPTQGGEWLANDGKHINAHGGNILYYHGTYYWYGEARSASGKPYSSLGVSLYTSKDLAHWTNRGMVLAVEDYDTDVCPGCIIERPKVVYNDKTKMFVMWFHLELAGQGYKAARYGIATSTTPTGPFHYIRSGRVNPGQYPIGFALPDTTDLRHQLFSPEMRTWWTPEWRKQIERGMFFMRDLDGGQMARDMTIFIDDDGKAYHIYSSEDNLTIQIAQLTDDCMRHNGSFVRVAAGGQNEAPTIFKKDGTYWMITSGCTGWAPNAARMFTAKNIFGPWKQLPNPCRGESLKASPNGQGSPAKTFGAQGTFILHLTDKKLARKFGSDYIFMADIWKPKELADSRHLWIPITFSDGKPVLALEPRVAIPD